jgi:hypothetical protein
MAAVRGHLLALALIPARTAGRRAVHLGIAGMTPAAGGAGASANPGGGGGAGGAAAQPGMDQASNNAGGGGGGAGRIYIRAAQQPALGGVVSPAVGVGSL